MGFLDKIRGSKDDTKQSKKQDDVLNMVKEETPQAKAIDSVTVAKQDTGRAYSVLQRGHLSEKTNILSTSSVYVFRVKKDANKIEIKKAVEATYDVNVISVNVLNVQGKVRKTGRIFGRTSDWKKAVVKLKQGQKISGLTEGV